MIRIHREGTTTIIIVTLLVLAVSALCWLSITSLLINISVTILMMLLLGFVMRFFRKPLRILPDLSQHDILAPADGVIIDIRDVELLEKPGEKVQRISIFMSANNVHINWVPISGLVRMHKYQPGKHLLARKPKSSILNERSSILIEQDNRHWVMTRQIAGTMARRVVTYPGSGQMVVRGEELGFIKFGSRVDVFLPMTAKVLVEKGTKSVGRVTVLAAWNR